MAKKISLSPHNIRRFQKTIHDFYKKNGRDLPWRRTHDPYHILVSEMMLQQTQVERVIEKYDGFLEKFPHIQSLAKSRLNKVLSLWQGLGYNRRALLLHRAAQKAVKECNGSLPPDPQILQQFPGIGPATAGAICAFSFNLPVVFIETNIRRVFIHFFFLHHTSIHDDQLMPLISSTLDEKNPRDWYYALMDYGTRLKKSSFNPNRRSAHYHRQSPFEGSNRQIRGTILRLLNQKKTQSKKDIIKAIGCDIKRIDKNLEQLTLEGFLIKKNDRFSIS